MHLPLTIELSPSRGVLASVLAVHAAAALTLFHVPLSMQMPTAVPGEGHGAVAAVAWGLLVVSLLLGVRAELGKRGTALRLFEDGAVEVSNAEGRTLLCRIGVDAVDLGWALWLHLRVEPGAEASAGEDRALPPGQGRGVVRGRRVMLVRANLPTAQWRWLRIWLRHTALRGEAGG
ncbi:protein YgfX [Thauera aromatica]|uniref:Toxin CptA n=1 Tax=Thauera aromatica K172 TaxID=44139 RepID=A0A2R4BMV6_THAAR|nr:protein YgfX [Thauera aromatica]AVR88523.1 hypothetical protein Tharo_1606 [Thauera aromatica K172]